MRMTVARSGSLGGFGVVIVAALLAGLADSSANQPQTPLDPSGSDSASRHPPPDPDEPPVAAINVPLDTVGGMQFWTDFVIRGGWRVQRNEVTGHYRLLDDSNVRQGWGNYAFCLQELDRRMPTDPRAVEHQHVVVLLHGLGRTRRCWDALALRLEHEGYCVVSFGYASTRGTLSDHAHALDHVLRHLEPCATVSFVAHSLGNLVVRRYLDEHPEPLPGAPRRGRMVMLGPPNLGAQMARRLKQSNLFRVIAGASGEQLSDHWREVEQHLATPVFEFGILAGGADMPASNPLVDGDDDLVVSVEETRLPGAADFRRVGATHSFLAEDDEAIDLTVHFLQTGCFETPDRRQPIAQKPNDNVE